MGSMEGWLYLIESNRLMMTNPRKRYFVICGNWACFWKDKPANREEVFAAVLTLGKIFRVFFKLIIHSPILANPHPFSGFFLRMWLWNPPKLQLDVEVGAAVLYTTAISLLLF